MRTKPLLAHGCLHPAQVDPYQVVNLCKDGLKVCQRLRYLLTAGANPWFVLKSYLAIKYLRTHQMHVIGNDGDGLSLREVSAWGLHWRRERCLGPARPVGRSTFSFGNAKLPGRCVVAMVASGRAAGPAIGTSSGGAGGQHCHRSVAAPAGRHGFVGGAQNRLRGQGAIAALGLLQQA